MSKLMKVMLLSAFSLAVSAPSMAEVETIEALPFTQEVIRLKLREFMTTTVVFPSWEKIEEVIIGDTDSFEANKTTEQVVLMKPKGVMGADSSITVIGGSGRVYNFYVRSEDFNSKNIPDLKVNVQASLATDKSDYRRW